eukprot:TRINITY_DN4017_c0_g1_i1.p1 TRINITY_DN4017_c0_g1~~TRINITY_DN4017_c0_g1_i1.p1  ORF type:complete len:841 (+),score=319.60 TRINITY_DN4017_c0_g1_i1:74-2524(+)
MAASHVDPTTPPTPAPAAEAADAQEPELWQVVGDGGAKVREAESLESAVVCTLLPREVCWVYSQCGSRCRLSAGKQAGWASVTNQDGETIMERATRPLGEAARGERSIVAKDSFVLKLQVPPKHSAQWVWRVEKHDVVFSATLDGKPLRQYSKDAKLKDGQGGVAGGAGSELVLKWDNSYSWRASKDIRYCIFYSADGELDLDDAGGFDPDLLARLRSMPVAEQVREDELTERVVDAFMRNDFAAAEKFAKERERSDPLCAATHAMFGLIRCVLSMERKDLDEATRRQRFADRFAKAVMPSESWAQWAQRGKQLLSRTEQPPPTNAQLRCQVLRGELDTLGAILLMLEESILGFVQAGFRLRRAYTAFHGCDDGVRRALRTQQKEGAERPLDAPGIPKGHEVPASQCGDGRGEYPDDVFWCYDMHTVGGIQANLGNINLALSGLPEKALKLVAAMGYSHDRNLGLRNLRRCFEARGLRSAVAGLGLLAHYITGASFSPIAAPACLPAAEEVLRQAAERWPRSCIFDTLMGRVRRLQRDTAGAIELLRRAREGHTGDFSQLTHFSLYEEVWCHCFDQNGAEALALIQRLQEESSWSKAFYAFWRGCCVYQSAGPEAAREAWELAPTLVVRKYAGKTVSVEQYVLRKCKVWTKFWGGVPPVCPLLELVMLFNGCVQLPVQHLAKLQGDAAAAAARLDASDAPEAAEQGAVAHLISATLLREQGEVRAARAEFEKLASQWMDGKKCKLKEERQVMPFALFEHACLEYQDGNRAKAKQLLALAREGKFGDYNFEMRLLVRIQITFHALVAEEQQQAAAAK